MIRVDIVSLVGEDNMNAIIIKLRVGVQRIGCMPHRTQDMATVKIGGYLLLVDIEGFNCSTPIEYIQSWSPLDFGCR